MNRPDYVPRNPAFENLTNVFDVRFSHVQPYLHRVLWLPPSFPPTPRSHPHPPSLYRSHLKCLVPTLLLKLCGSSFETLSPTHDCSVCTQQMKHFHLLMTAQCTHLLMIAQCAHSKSLSLVCLQIPLKLLPVIYSGCACHYHDVLKCVLVTWLGHCDVAILWHSQDDCRSGLAPRGACCQRGSVCIGTYSMRAITAGRLTPQLYDYIQPSLFYFFYVHRSIYLIPQ